MIYSRLMDGTAAAETLAVVRAAAGASTPPEAAARYDNIALHAIIFDGDDHPVAAGSLAPVALVAPPGGNVAAIAQATPSKDGQVLLYGLCAVACSNDPALAENAADMALRLLLDAARRSGRTGIAVSCPADDTARYAPFGFAPQWDGMLFADMGALRFPRACQG